MSLLTITTKLQSVNQSSLNLKKVKTPNFNLMGGNLFKGVRLMFATSTNNSSNGAGFFWR